MKVSSRHLALVGAVEQAVLQQEGGAVRDERVALHLAEAHAAPAAPPLDGLPRERVHGARGAHLPLVGHHVAQPLVVHEAAEDVGAELAPVHAAVEALRAVVVVAAGLQQPPEVARRGVALREAEGGRVVDLLRGG